MTDITKLLERANRLHDEFVATIDREFPGRGEWDWYRALPDRGVACRNEDQSDDAALAASRTIRIAHDAYIAALHAFYRARDGEHGFLGRRA